METAGIKIVVDGSDAIKSVGSLKQQLKEAQKEVEVLSEKFGASSQEAINAAKKAAQLKDAIGDAKDLTDAFNPDAKFKAFSQSLSAVAGGFSAVQGALGLLGVESDQVEKTLLKVQSAMALSQGLQAIGEGIDAFKRMGTVAVNVFKSIRAAIGSTGIGLLVIALASLVAYWDDIKGAISGVSAEQKRLNAEAEKNLKSEQEKLSAIDAQTNQLRLQGKSEREILNIKIAQTDEAIKAAQVSLEQAKATKVAQVEAAKRNRDFLKGIIDFVATPTQLIYRLIDTIGKALGQDWNLEATNQAVLDSMSNYVFDPAAVATEGDEAIKESENILNELKEKRASFQLGIQQIDKQASQTGKENRDKENQKLLEAQQILQEARNKRLSKSRQEELEVEKSYDEKFKKLKEANIKDDGTLETAKQNELKAIREKYALEEKTRIQEFEKELGELRTKTRLDSIKDEFEKRKEELKLDYESQRKEILDNEKTTVYQKIALLAELKKQEIQALATIEDEQAKAKSEKEMAELDRQIQKNDSDFELERELLNRKEQLLKEQLANNIKTQDQYNEAYEALSKARQDIDKQEAELKKAQVQEVGNVIQNLTNIVGKETAAGKALGIATALINTYQGASEAIKQKSTLPSPFDVIAKVANVGAIIATGLKTVKSITAVQVPGGGGATQTGPSFSAAPIPPAPTPQVQSTLLNAQAIQTLGNATSRSYVIESDVSSSQERIRRINRAARLG